MTTGTRQDWLTDRILRGLIGGMGLLPYGVRVKAMGWVMRRIIGPLAGYRKRALAHVKMVWPELDHAAQRRIARASLDNAGRTLIENYSGAELSDRLANTQPTGEGLDALAEAAASGRPVLFVTGHFGNYEAPRHVLTRMGHSIGGIYKAMGNPYFNEHYVQTLQGVSGPVFEKGRSGTIGFARHLKSGGMATILFDVADTSGPALPFLGHPAGTSLAAAELALKFNALVLPYFGTRGPDGLSFSVEIESPIGHSTPEQMMREITRRLERRITNHPGQWFWVHRRWKTGKTRPVTP